MDCELHWLVTVEGKKEKQDSGRAESALDLNTPEIQNVQGLKRGTFRSLVNLYFSFGLGGYLYCV